MFQFRQKFRDFADTAGAIASLDAVIAVDTAVAHLAGAMGKPLFLLLPFAADFRWLRERQDSPWYPTARLFRQPAFGDWDSVIERCVAIYAADFFAGAQALGITIVIHDVAIACDRMPHEAITARPRSRVTSITANQKTRGLRRGAAGGRAVSGSLSRAKRSRGALDLDRMGFVER